MRGYFSYKKLLDDIFIRMLFIFDATSRIIKRIVRFPTAIIGVYGVRSFAENARADFSKRDIRRLRCSLVVMVSRPVDSRVF